MEITALPFSAPDIAIALTQASKESQDKPNREICHVFGENVGSVGDADPFFLAFSQIDLVEPDAEAGDNLKLGEIIDELSISAGRSISNDGADGVPMSFQKDGFLRRSPEAKKVEALLKLVLEVGRHGAHHKDSD